MRPNSLIVEGLTCFRDRQEIDFSRLDVFAIVGPTGAGKSSLLEAMVYALYGEMPRVNDHNRSHLISASRDSASVILDFNVGPTRYRIGRKLKRKGSASVLLEKHDGQEFNETLADQIKPAHAKILEILGLDETAFKQAVVLPQGEFATFLRADPKARREMLGALLGVDIYERMRARAHNTASQTKALVESQRGMLDAEYREVTPEALAALEASRTALAEALVGLRTELEDSQRSLTLVRDQFSKTTELRACEARLEDLRRQGTAIDLQRAQLDAARRAAPLLPLFSRADQDARAAAAAQVSATQAAATQVAAQTEADGKEKARADAELAAAPMPDLRRQVILLNRIVGTVAEARGLWERLASQKSALGALDAAIGLAKREIEAAEKAVAARGVALEGARQRLLGASYDADLDSALEAARERAAALGAARSRVTSLKEEEVQRKKAVDQATSQLEPLARAAAGAQDAVAETAKAATTAEETLRQAQAHDVASHLREGLKPGEPCPVCDRTIEGPLPKRARPAVKKAEQARVAAVKRHQEAEAKAELAKERVTEARATLKAATADLAATAISARTVESALAAAEQQLRLALGPHGAAAQGRLEEWVQARLGTLAKARKAHATAQEEVHQLEVTLGKAQSDLSRAANAVAEKEKARTAGLHEHQQGEHHLAELRAKIAEVTSAQDPEAEATALVRKIEDLEAGLKSAGALAQAASTRLAAASEAAKQKLQAAEDAKATAAISEKHCGDQIAQAGFTSAAAARAASLTDSETTRLAEQVARHDLDSRTVEERAGALKVELGEARVSREDVDAAEKRGKEAGSSVEAHRSEYTKVEQQAGHLRERLARSTAMRAQLVQSEARLQVYERLAGDLRTDKLQAYVLQEAFNDLVQGASLRLMQLTNQRYSLQFKDEAIWVSDWDNAGEARISDTLSGGETFLASLALALELSAHVLREAGLVRLDSLFIDEGFGSLDPIALADAIAVLHDLQVGGRMVGIITHIPTLQEEFPKQIVVTKHVGFSTVDVRGVEGAP